MRNVNGTILLIQDGGRYVCVERVGLRAYKILVRASPKNQYTLGPVGVPVYREAAIDRGLEVAGELGLMDRVHLQRVQARRALRRTEGA